VQILEILENFTNSMNPKAGPPKYVGFVLILNIVKVYINIFRNMKINQWKLRMFNKSWKVEESNYRGKGANLNVMKYEKYNLEINEFW